jgi:hypothetical protein
MSEAIRQHKLIAMGKGVDGGAKGDRGPAQKYARGGRVSAERPSTPQPFKKGGKPRAKGC